MIDSGNDAPSPIPALGAVEKVRETAYLGGALLKPLGHLTLQRRAQRLQTRVLRDPHDVVHTVAIAP